jgi:hypothetical protein
MESQQPLEMATILIIGVGVIAGRSSLDQRPWKANTSTNAIIVASRLDQCPLNEWDFVLALHEQQGGRSSTPRLEVNLFASAFAFVPCI